MTTRGPTQPTGSIPEPRDADEPIDLGPLPEAPPDTRPIDGRRPTLDDLIDLDSAPTERLARCRRRI